MRLHKIGKNRPKSVGEVIQVILNFAYPEFVWFYLSRKHPEFCIPGICLVLFVQNMPKICPEFFHIRNLSRNSRSNSGQLKIPGIFLGQIPDDQKFWISKIMQCPDFSGHIPDVFWMHPDVLRDVFRTFLFYREHSTEYANKLHFR